MAKEFLATQDYRTLITQIKQSIQQARSRAIRSVNSELVGLYYKIGKQIVQKQENSNWGEDLIGQIEIDLKLAFPDLSGFSRRNLNYMRKLYIFFGGVEKVPQLVAQIPWGHIRLILDKIKNYAEAEFYVRKTIENSWSRVMLDHQIDLRLFQRQGKIISNFKATVEAQEVALIQEAFKESYVLDFLGLDAESKERDLEQALIENMTNFMLELGKGFAFAGKQFKLTVGGQEFFVDLLFYNYLLNRFVVVELKTTEFKPEYVGQLGFYLTAIDRDVKNQQDGETIGLLICKNKNNTVVEYALAGNGKPAGVAQYQLFADLPAEVQKYLPTEDELSLL
ncbi:MAG: PDDEXK nuclease domain-containing protein [Candidatus Moraniibacteriota bacterium]